MSATLLTLREQSRAPSRLRTVRVALAGCGVVGGELVRLLDAHAQRIAGQQRIRLQIVKVLVRDVDKLRAVPLPGSLFTNDLAEFLACDAEVVVEAIGGIEPAAQIARSALVRGAHFVTANKALLAACGDQLLALAHRAGGTVDFEAAVAGGIPIVRALRSSLSSAPIRHIEGILNGTCNYILTRIEQGADFDTALREAQRNGFAEADPSRDLQGVDSADKLRVLAWLAFGISPHALHVDVQGIARDVDALVREAAVQNQAVRLIASCECDVAGRVHASVRPTLVARDTVFAQTRNEQNVVVVDFGWSQPVAFSGPGAGGLPTASALLGDILCC